MQSTILSSIHAHASSLPLPLSTILSSIHQRSHLHLQLPFHLAIQSTIPSLSLSCIHLQFYISYSLSSPYYQKYSLLQNYTLTCPSTLLYDQQCSLEFTFTFKFTFHHNQLNQRHPTYTITYPSSYLFNYTTFHSIELHLPLLISKR